MENPWLIYMYAINRQHKLSREARENRLSQEASENHRAGRQYVIPQKGQNIPRLPVSRNLSLLRNKTVSL